MPAVNIIDNEGEYEIEVAAPGLKKEDFNIAIENRLMTITVHTEREEQEKNKKFARHEFTYRSFIKSFTLPQEVDPDSINARYEDGILRILLTKDVSMIPPKKEVAVL